MLAEVGREVSSTLDLSIVLERIARRARHLLRADVIAIFLRHLHVAFVHETPRERIQEDAGDQPELALTSREAIVAALQEVPAPWRTGFYHAVVRADIVRIAQLVAQVAPQQPALAKTLNDLAEMFDYQQLLDLVQSAQQT